MEEEIPPFTFKIVNMLKREIESFLVEKQGYLKKSPLEVAKAIWKISSKHTLPKNRDELVKELKQIKEVQTDLRLAKTLKTTEEEDILLQTYQEILQNKNKPKRKLFFDLETSPNIVFSWRIGRKINLSHDDIIKERAIICACYKWQGEETVHSLQWNKGDDKELVAKLAKIMDSADEVITQNGDAFDIKWMRARCIYHDVSLSPKFNSIDTLKFARAGFNFNSNKLDYVGKFLGIGGKIKTDYDLWKDIILKNDVTAMNKMVAYCKMDVIRLEQVYDKLQKFCPVKKFRYKL